MGPTRSANLIARLLVSLMVLGMMGATRAEARNRMSSRSNLSVLNEQLAAACAADEYSEDEENPGGRVAVAPFPGRSGPKLQKCVVSKLIRAGCEKIVRPTIVKKVERRRGKLTQAKDFAWLARTMNLGVVISAAPRRTRAGGSLLTFRDRSGRVIDVLQVSASAERSLCRDYEMAKRQRFSPASDSGNELEDESQNEAAPDSESEMDTAEEDTAAEEESAIASRPRRTSLAQAPAPAPSPFDSSSAGSGGGVSRSSSLGDDLRDDPLPGGQLHEWKSSALSVSAGVQMVFRGFRYEDELAAGSRKYRYDLPAAPALTLAAEAMPGREAQKSWPAQLSLVGDLETTLSSKLNNPNFGPQTAKALHFGLGVRASRVISNGQGSVYFQLGYGKDAFTVDAPISQRAGPNVDYSYFEPGVGGTYALSPSVMATGWASYRAVLGAGELTTSTFLRESKVTGFAGGLLLGWRASSSIEFQVDARVKYYGARSTVQDANFLSGFSQDLTYRIGPALSYRL